MTQREAVIHEVERLPEELLAPVLLFVQRLKQGEHDAARATAWASESALSKDWLRPEEDEAWGDL